MTHGTFAVWHVAEGASVRQGDPLFDIETEKAAMEVEAPASGRLHHVSAKPGDRIAVGTAIAWLYGEGEEVGPPPGGAPAVPERPVAEVRSTVPEPAAAATGASMAPTTVGAGGTTTDSAIAAERPRATPAARSAARSASIELSSVAGSGPKGRIQRDDVDQLVRRSEEAPKSIVTGLWIPEAGPLNVTRRPGSGVPLLLIHGFTADSKSWAPLEKAIGTERPLIRIDLPGHGRSPKRKVTDFAALARMIVESFDDALADGEAVHVIAHSLGGALALAVADIRPRKIRSLTLIAPAGLGPEINADALNGIVLASHPASLGPWLRVLPADPAGISDEYVKAAFQLRSEATLRAAQADMSRGLFRDGVQTFDLRPALARLHLPLQIIWGKQDGVLPMRQALNARGEFALHLIDGVGHIPQYEIAERTARIALRFVAGVEGTS